MFGIGETELLIIVVFAFILIGPDKLPTMGRTIGKGLRQFREAQDGFTKVVQTEFVDPMNAITSGEALEKDKSKAAATDADIDEGAAPKETFAERKRRLEAEAAGEGAEGVAAEAAGDAAGPVEEKPKPARTAASLYGLSRRSAKASAGKDDAAGAGEREAKPASGKDKAAKPKAKAAKAGAKSAKAKAASAKGKAKSDKGAAKSKGKPAAEKGKAKASKAKSKDKAKAKSGKAAKAAKKSGKGE